MDADAYAQTVSELCDLPLVAKTIPESLVEDGKEAFAETKLASLVYPIRLYVKNPWE